MTGIAESEVAILEDPVTGLVRIALYSGKVLKALFFSALEPVQLSRRHAISLVGTETAPMTALAGRSAADQPDPGPTVCACFSVGLNTLRDAVANGANTVEALGEVTCAGTNCGSCKPELAALIAKARPAMAAE
ncbi:MAG: (2Fe-2S)-binding protein [Pseudomonadota bacterium]|nr:(2Fe-2S)-binding protein [Pseudomonadota bacterium]